jgi:hypothetical protein
MSIRDEIKERMRDGRLYCLEPTIESAQVSRCMFVSRSIHEKIQPTDDDDHDQRFSALRSDLDKFVTGGQITVAHHPYKKSKKAYIARTDPTSGGIWDIRSIDPRPGLRVLGCFAEVDVFVALEWEFRINLGGPDDKRWRDFIVRCKANWNRTFGPYRPLIGGQTSDFISNNYFDV